MSRTDKTAPYQVKLRRGDLETYEYHDHRNGVCDLASDPDRFEYAKGGCYKSFHYTGTGVCCCTQCRAVEWPRTETQRRRRDRRTAKQELRKTDPDTW